MNENSPDKNVPQLDRGLLLNQIDDWEKKGLINDDIAESLKLDVKGNTSLKSPFIQKNIIKIISWVGGVLIGLGILLFVASNWQYLGNSFRTLLIFASVAVFHAIGILIKQKDPKSILANIFHLIGSAAFAGGLFLLGQIYHVSYNDYSQVLFLIALGTIPLAYVVAARPILTAGLGAFYAAICFSLFNNSSLGSTYPIIFLLIGMSMYIVGAVQRRLPVPQNLPGAFQNIGALTIVATLLIASYEYTIPSNRVLDGLLNLSIPVYGLLILGIGALGYSAVQAAKTNDRAGVLEVVGFIGLLIFTFFQTLVAFASNGVNYMSYSEAGFGSQGFYLLLANISCVLGIGLLFAIAVQRKSKSLINISLIGICAYIFLRYIDTLATMLTGSLAFIIGGVILLGIGYILEKKRRDIYRQFDIE